MQASLLLLSAYLTFATSFADDGQQRKKLGGLDKANDVATAMVVDGAGNMYMTGYSKSSKTGYDFLTLKYKSNGDLAWAERYDGGSGGDDRPTAIAVDATGGVFITGSSEGDGSGSDYLTVKYNAGGNFQWAKRFNGSGDGYDRPGAIAVDRAGDAYVTGFSLGNGTGYDCVTVKYGPEGNELWSQAYNDAVNGDDFGESIRLDDAGNAFVVGYSRLTKSQSNYLLVKYNPAGKVVWSQMYNGGRPQDARANGIAIAKNGRMLISGYVAGAHGLSDILAISLDSNGKKEWQYRFDGAANGEDKPTGVATDSEGNFYIIGASQGEGSSGKDFVTLKLSPAGKPLWTVRYNGAGDGDDVPAAIAISSRGPIVVTGASAGIDSGSDFLTVMYGPDGKPIWSQRYNGEANDVDRPISVGVDASGAVYVAGSSWGGKTSGFDFLAIKYSADGKQQWLRRYDGGGKTQNQ